jgi:hypothetical protein
VAARVVTDAAANGTLQISRRGTRARLRLRLRLRGRGVPRSRLALRTAGRTTHMTGTVGRRHVDVPVAT